MPNELHQLSIATILGGIGGVLSKLPILPNQRMPERMLLGTNFLTGCFLALVFALFTITQYDVFKLYGLSGLVGYFSATLAEALKNSSLIKSISNLLNKNVE